MSESTPELERLLELDYERTSGFIQAVVGSSTTIRGLAITLWLALIGFGIDHRQPSLAVIAVVAVLVFATLDIYYSALYQAAFERAVELEDVTALYYQSISIGRHDPDLARRLQEKQIAWPFGLFTHLHKVRVRNWIDALPRTFIGVYLLLTALGLGISFYVYLSPDP